MPSPQFVLPPLEGMRESVRRVLDRTPLTAASLEDALLLLAKYRSHWIQWEFARRYGATIRAGPFAGLDFVDHGFEGAHVPKLLGCYEHELHGFIEAAIATDYGTVVNIGCAEGYYALGLAWRMPAARIHAFDIDPAARRACSEAAGRNGFAGRVSVAERFTPAMFADFAGRKAIVIVDIEGMELELLRSAPSGSLAGLDFVVECHVKPGTASSTELAKLLESTHVTRILGHELGPVVWPPFLREAGNLDQLLAVWEWRRFPTPWLVAASRVREGTPFWNAVSR